MNTSTELLAELNGFRIAEGKAPYKDWRSTRHASMLAEYRKKAQSEDFESSAEEIAAQKARPSVIEKETDVTIETLESTTSVSKAPKQPKASVGKEKTVAKDRGPTYKEVANYDRSAVMKPVEFVHAFLNQHGHELTRKEAVVQLVSKGINYATARTQYQRWFTNNKKGA